MPLADYRNIGRGEQVYGYSPSGPGPYAPQPLQPPTNWMDQLQKMLRNATTGLDPARQQPRTIQTTDPGAGYGMSPSGPTARLGSAQFPDTPSDAPRAGTWMHGNVQRPKGQGVIEQFSVPANYGQSPSNPNWGQDRGGSVGKMGPTNVPASTNYNAISPSNRIAGNVAAVMQGRTGPSPGVTPHLNQSGRLESPPNARPWTGFGPTGEPLPSRQHVRKPMSPYYQPGG